MAANFFSRTVSIILRFLELAFAIIVAGIVGHSLHQSDEANATPLRRVIYTEVVAGLSILTALLLLFPMTYSFAVFAVDFILFILWIVAFGLLQSWLGPFNCGYSYWPWNDNSEASSICEQWKAVVAFSFLSAVAWLITFVLGVLAYRRVRSVDGSVGASTRRKGFFGRR